MKIAGEISLRTAERLETELAGANHAIQERISELHLEDDSLEKLELLQAKACLLRQRNENLLRIIKEQGIPEDEIAALKREGDAELEAILLSLEKGSDERL